jgi:nucleoside-diphosphate-sugar epimerase
MQILITGANGFLGSRMVDFFLEQGIYNICAVDFNRMDTTTNPKYANSRITSFSVDLTKPLPIHFSEVIEKSDVIIHLAWTRDGKLKENILQNQIMIDQLIERIRNKNNFYFFNSVAGTPKTFSEYGKSKYFLTSHVLSKKGTVLTCGLVVEKDPQAGSYRLLYNLVKKYKFSFRIIKNDLKVYPIRIDDIVKSIDHIANHNMVYGNYKLYSNSVLFNDFISLLEKLTDRKRVRFLVPHKLMVAFLGFFNSFIPNIRIIEQFLTFFYKESEYLDNLKDIPNLTLTSCDDAEFFG